MRWPTPHDRGVIHRDLKPANILLAKVDDKTPDGCVLDRRGNRTGLVRTQGTDFGLAKKTEGDSQLTGTGQILARPVICPPNRLAARPRESARWRMCIRLGAILYCLLTGRPPFQSANVMDTLIQVLEKEPVPLRQLSPDVPVDLETVSQKCLEKSQEKRYASANDLGQELDRFLRAGRSWRAPWAVWRGWRWCRRNRSLASSLAAAVLFLLAGIIVSTSFGHCGDTSSSRGN